LVPATVHSDVLVVAHETRVRSPANTSVGMTVRLTVETGGAMHALLEQPWKQFWINTSEQLEPL
jgi:hypothetical protein